MTLSGKTVERLSVYRRLLSMQGFSGDDSVYSHQLAEMVSGTAAQVRRDLMEVGVTGHSKRGYRVDHLVTEIGRLLDDPAGSRIVLVGVGDLGRALLRFMKGHHERLRVVGAFDSDPTKIGCVVHGYRCRPMNDLERVIEDERVGVAIIATPAEGAQTVCDRLVAAGVRGVVNFAPSPLHVPEGIWVERVDIATALEKVACLGRWTAGQEAPAEVVATN
jgi:redox-sensing transcriptional repressor